MYEPERKRCDSCGCGAATLADKARTKAIAVVGAQWGDEGKGKVVDCLAQSFDYTARYAGGHNAGHTVIFNSHRFVLQLVPSGILRPEKKAVIGPGAVVDPAALVAEIENLRKSGSSRSQTRIPRRAILSSYAGPMPREVVPIFASPRADSAALSISR